MTELLGDRPSPLRLRVASLGKGGSGKSVVTGTLCRHLARRGHRVLALDVDTVPGMAMSLGAPRNSARLPTGLAEVVETRRGRRWKLLKGSGAAYLVDHHALAGPDGIRFIELGNLPGGVEPATTMVFRHVMEHFRRPGWTVVADLAAGTRQPVFGWASFAQFRLVVVDPSAKSRLTARRIAHLGTHLVVNKVRSEAEAALVAAELALPLLATIPYDEALAEAEQQGAAPIDRAPDSPAVRAIAELAGRLEELT